MTTILANPQCNDRSAGSLHYHYFQSDADQGHTNRLPSIGAHRRNGAKKTQKSGFRSHFPQNSGNVMLMTHLSLLREPKSPRFINVSTQRYPEWVSRWRQQQQQQKKLPFLDVLLHKVPFGKFETSDYRKATSADNVLQYDSNCLAGRKRSRITNHCSNGEVDNQVRNYLHRLFGYNGYPLNFFVCWSCIELVLFSV